MSPKDEQLVNVATPAEGESLSWPHSLPMPSIGPRVHELRIQDPSTSSTWRIVYCAVRREIVVIDVFAKRTQTAPKQVIDRCKQRLRVWDRDGERS